MTGSSTIVPIAPARNHTVCMGFIRSFNVSQSVRARVVYICKSSSTVRVVISVHRRHRAGKFWWGLVGAGVIDLLA